MLAGLIFATGNADDRPNALTATLPFGGVTLIEFQARLLIAAGVSQIVVVVARLTPELLGAVNRIGKRGVTVDVVRTAVEAQEKLHPLAKVIVVADGLVTSEAIVDTIAVEGGDALLVVYEDQAGPQYERLGGHLAWGGLARLDPQRVAEVAALPRDYDFQSTLLRVAAQVHAEQIPLPRQAALGMHGIDRDSRALVERGKALLAERVSSRRSWADRDVAGRVARLALPQLVARNVRTLVLSLGGTLLGAVGLAALWFDWPGIGMGITFVACVTLTIGAALAWLRDEENQARVQQWMVPVFAALAALLLARIDADITGTGTAWALALAGLVAAAITERAGNDRIRRRWWASPIAYPLLLFPFALAGFSLIGLGLAAAYAGATLAAAVEALREKP